MLQFPFAVQRINRLSDNFCLELIEPSARDIYFWTLVEREERGMIIAQTYNLEKASELKQTVDPQPL